MIDCLILIDLTNPCMKLLIVDSAESIIHILGKINIINFQQGTRLECVLGEVGCVLGGGGGVGK